MSTGAAARAKFALVFDVGCSLDGWDLYNFVFERRLRITAAGRRGFLNQKILYTNTPGDRRLTLEGFGVSDASPDLRAAWTELEPKLRALIRVNRHMPVETAFTAKLTGISEVVDLLRAFDASVPFLSRESATPPRLVRSRLSGRDQPAIHTALRLLQEQPLRLPAEHAVAFQRHRPRRTRTGWRYRPYILAIPEGIEAGLVLWTKEAGRAQRRAAESAGERLRRASFEGEFHRICRTPGLHGFFARRVRTRAQLLDAVRFASSFDVDDTAPAP